MMVKKRTNSCQQSQKSVKTKEKFFNYRIKRRYTQDYCLENPKKKLEDKKVIKKGGQT